MCLSATRVLLYGDFEIIQATCQSAYGSNLLVPECITEHVTMKQSPAEYSNNYIENDAGQEADEQHCRQRQVDFEILRLKTDITR